MYFKKNTQLKKREKAELIIFNKPKVRYVGDLTDIPTELKKDTKYNFIFSIIAHFSKFADSYLLIDKTQKSILDSLIYFFTFYDEPIEFGCDNGRESINSC